MGEGARVVRANEAERHAEDGVEIFIATGGEGSPTDIWFGRFTSAPGVKIPRHHHTSDTVAYCISGGAAFDIGEDATERLTVGPGDYVFVPAGVVHTEETVGSETADFVIARNRHGGETTYLDE